MGLIIKLLYSISVNSYTLSILTMDRHDGEYYREYDGEIKEWFDIFEHDHKCSCGEYIIKGYKYIDAGTNKKCSDCYRELLHSNKKFYTPFTTPRITINSNYLCSVVTSDMCLQSFPCQHYISIQLSNFYSENDKIKYEKHSQEHNTPQMDYVYHSISYPVDGIKILKLLLLTGEDTSHFSDYSSKIPIMKPGNKIRLDDYITVIVNSSFVDPRQ